MQINALGAFRDALEGEKLTFEGHQDDTTYCRFLKARKWEVDKALAMWRSMYTWRKTFADVPAQPPFSSNERALVRSPCRVVLQKLATWADRCAARQL